MNGSTIPTLVIASENDTLFKSQLIREVSIYIHGAEMIELPTPNHSPYFETLDLFDATVAELLSNHV